MVEILEGRKFSPQLSVQGFTRRSHTICNECAELFAISVQNCCTELLPGQCFLLLPFIFLIKTFQIDQKGKLTQVTVIL